MTGIISNSVTIVPIAIPLSGGKNLSMVHGTIFRKRVLKGKASIEHWIVLIVTKGVSALRCRVIAYPATGKIMKKQMTLITE